MWLYEHVACKRGDNGNMMRRSLSLLVPLLFAAALAGCGFHLRGSTNLAFSRLAVQGPEGPFLIDFRRQVASTSNTRIVTDPKQAQAIFTLLADNPTQTALAYNADGTVAQFQLRETVSFQLTAPNGHMLIAPTTITQTSSLSYSTTATLAKANEADMLYRGMRQALVNRIMFQLAKVRPPGASALAASAPSSP